MRADDAHSLSDRNASPSAADNRREDTARDESADVGHVGHTCGSRRVRDRADTTEELQHDPESDHDQRRHLHDLLALQHPHASLWKQDDVRAQHARPLSPLTHRDSVRAIRRSPSSVQRSRRGHTACRRL
jgi:hypothetical protein